MMIFYLMDVYNDLLIEIIMYNDIIDLFVMTLLDCYYYY